MKPIKLTICICSLHERADMLCRLLSCLSAQKRLDEVQILVNVDAGQLTIGTKRNYLVNDALGEYICHIDDDDIVSSHYIEDILTTIDAYPQVDAIAIRGRRSDVHNDKPDIVFDYRLSNSPEIAEAERGVLWRSPGHLCPIRACLARAVMFPEVEPEDIAWVSMIAPFLKRVVHAGITRPGGTEDILYFYLWDSKKTYRWNRP